MKKCNLYYKIRFTVIKTQQIVLFIIDHSYLEILQRNYFLYKSFFYRISYLCKQISH